MAPPHFLSPANGVGEWNRSRLLVPGQHKEPLKKTEIEWEGSHGFRLGLGVRESTAGSLFATQMAAFLESTIKPPSTESLLAILLLSDAFPSLGGIELLPKTAPQRLKKRVRRLARVRFNAQAAQLFVIETITAFISTVVD